jgi:hypothetical protein
MLRKRVLAVKIGGDALAKLERQVTLLEYAIDDE